MTDIAEVEIDTTDTVLMIRDPEQWQAPHQANVHISEVGNWAIGGWLLADHNTLEESPKAGEQLPENNTPSAKQDAEAKEAEGTGTGPGTDDPVPGGADDKATKSSKAK